jgi:PhzF family phenazine biosynthesis protein
VAGPHRIAPASLAQATHRSTALHGSRHVRNHLDARATVENLSHGRYIQIVVSVAFTKVDAFAAAPFAGNPAAVIVLPKAADEQWMQNVAREMNLSETAFLVRREDGSYDLRWFTPSVEIALCGHATLASAHALWESNALGASETARFHTKSGLLTAVRDAGWIELNFPATPAAEAPAPSGLIEALSVAPIFVGKTRFDYLVEVDSEDAVRTASPDFTRLRTLPVRGVMITSAASTSNVDFVSRFFAPGSGIDEDPVTGSAHCCLTPYWSQRLGRTSLVARQLSARGGELRVRLDHDRVRMAGQAITVMRGDVLV